MELVKKLNSTKYGIGIENSYFQLPLMTAFSVSDSSNITEYPLVNRLQIIDHKYDNPRTISITTSFSNHSSIEYYPYVDRNVIVYKKLHNKSEYLTKIYEFFTQLKRESWILKVLSPSQTFKNLVIESFNWNDNGQWAEITLNFKEIYTYIIEEVKTQIDPGDKNLPNITDLIPQDFVNTVLLKKSKETDLFISNVLKKEKLLQESFAKGMVAAGVFGVLGAVAITALVAWGIAAAVINSVPIIGQIISAAMIVIGLVIAGVTALIIIIKEAWERYKRRKIYYDDFVGYENETDMKKEVKRYSDTVQNIYKGISRLNNVIKCYTLPSNINQSLNLTLNGENYQLFFNAEDNNNDKWYFTIKDYNDEVVYFGDKKMENVAVEPLLTFYEATNEECLFKVGDDKLYIVQNPEFLDDIILVDRNKKIIPGKKKKINLDRIFIVTTVFNLDKFKETIKQATLTAMKKKKE